MIPKSPLRPCWTAWFGVVGVLAGFLALVRLEAAENVIQGGLPTRLRLDVVIVGPASADLREAIEESARTKLQAAGCVVVQGDEPGPIAAAALALFTSEARGNCSFCLSLSLHERVRPERSVDTIIPAATWTTWRMDLSGGATHAGMLRSAEEAVDELVAAGNPGGERNVRGVPPIRVDVKVDVKTEAGPRVGDQGR